MMSPSNMASEVNTFYQGNQFLRKDMQNDADDKYSDKTMRSVFNQFHSNNTSYIGINYTNENELGKQMKDAYKLSDRKV